MRHIPEEELHAYLDQALSRAQAVEIETHLAGCARCRGERDAIAYAWDLITKDYGLPKDKLYVTVFREDDEAEELWQRVAGVPKDRIAGLPGVVWGFCVSTILEKCESNSAHICILSFPCTMNEQPGWFRQKGQMARVLRFGLGLGLGLGLSQSYS